MLTRILLIPLMTFSYFLRALPLKGVGFLGAGLGAILQLVGFRTTIVENNMQLCLAHEKSPQEIRQLKKQFYRHIGTLFLEIVRNFTLTREQFVNEVYIAPKDLEKLDQMKARGQGMLVISAHIANWEIFPSSIAGRGYPVSIVAKKMSSPISQTLIEQRRITAGFDVLYTGNTLNKIKEAISKGVFVGCMVDQHQGGPKGIRVNFFGTPAASIRGLANLAREIRCTVMPICIYRQPDGTHRLHIMDELTPIEAPELPAGSPERFLREEWLNTQKYQEVIEQMIRQHPEQWLWIHRRWKANKTPLNFSTAHLEQNV
ncbi:lysophospholipid acyltransferase family protein [bacterium]|nr:lysophospholipid acyltransferase family protein [bacterium]